MGLAYKLLHTYLGNQIKESIPAFECTESSLWRNGYSFGVHFGQFFIHRRYSEMATQPGVVLSCIFICYSSSIFLVSQLHLRSEIHGNSSHFFRKRVF